MQKECMGLRNHCTFSVADCSVSCCIFLAKKPLKRLRRRLAQLYCKWLRVKSCCNLTMAVFGEVPSSLHIFFAIHVIIRQRRSKFVLQSLLKSSIAVVWTSILNFKQNAGLASVKQVLLSAHGHFHDPSACACTRFLSILEKHKKCMHMHYTRGIEISTP